MKRLSVLFYVGFLMFSSSVLAYSAIQPDTSAAAGTGMGVATNKVLGLVQFIGYAIAIGMLIYIGIKYATASANEKADLKGASVKYVIGAILIAGATAVAGWFFTIGNGISGQAGGTGGGSTQAQYEIDFDTESGKQVK